MAIILEPSEAEQQVILAGRKYLKLGRVAPAAKESLRKEQRGGYYQPRSIKPSMV